MKNKILRTSALLMPQKDLNSKEKTLKQNDIYYDQEIYKTLQSLT